MDYNLKKKAVRKFFSFMNERHEIYLRRQRGVEWPWTDDPILQTYRFCNIFRELDTVTIWIRENWREPYADHKNLWFAMAMARLINWPDTLEEIGYPEKWEPKRVLDILEKRKARGDKIYTGAYIITGQLGGTKISQSVYKVLDPLYKNPPKFAYRTKHAMNTLEDSNNQLIQHTGFGRFMAYEVVTDLRHTRYLDAAPDIMTWANPGPGAVRGINRILGLPVKLSQLGNVAAYVDMMRKLLDHKEAQRLVYHGFPNLELRDIEHTLCEFDKYERVRKGEGRPRAKYQRTD